MRIATRSKPHEWRPEGEEGVILRFLPVSLGRYHAILRNRVDLDDLVAGNGGELSAELAEPIAFELLEEVCVEALVGWEGIEDLDGEPLACNEPNARDLFRDVGILQAFSSSVVEASKCVMAVGLGNSAGVSS